MSEPNKKWEFQPGTSGNAAGRPKGTRNRLSGDFIKALAEDFADHGIEAIRVARTEDPVAYVKLIGSLVPKELALTDTTVDELNDDETRELIATIRWLKARAAGTAIADALGAEREPEPTAH